MTLKELKSPSFQIILMNKTFDFEVRQHKDKPQPQKRELSHNLYTGSFGVYEPTKLPNEHQILQQYSFTRSADCIFLHSSFRGA